MQALVSVSTIGKFDNRTDEQLAETVKRELSQWFGAVEVQGWRHLRTYRIPFAQPNQVRSLGWTLCPQLLSQCSELLLI